MVISTINYRYNYQYLRILWLMRIIINNVLLVKIEGPGAGIPSIIIYLLLKGFLQTPLFSSTNQWEKDIYAPMT